MAVDGYHERRAASATLGAEVRGLRFDKLEGLGNDFVVLDERDNDAPSLSLEARVALCDRAFGVGADGVLTLLRSRDRAAAVRMHVTNADGSEPEMCGNGLRCVSRWLVERGLVPADGAHAVDTDAGVKGVRAHDDGTFEVDMGPAAFLDDAPQGDEVEAGGARYLGRSVSMGNPHLVLEAPADVALALRVGPALERHPAFPQRTNVGFASPRGRAEVDLVVFERGSGLTLACGTGACAAAAAMVKAGHCTADTPIVVNLPGGPLTIVVPGNPRESVKMRGPARFVFSGAMAG